MLLSIRRVPLPAEPARKPRLAIWVFPKIRGIPYFDGVLITPISTHGETGGLSFKGLAFFLALAIAHGRTCHYYDYYSYYRHY